MRHTFLIAVLLTTLSVAACGDHGDPQVTKLEAPFGQVRDQLDGSWSGVLLLDDGEKRKTREGRVLGPWVCGQVRYRDFCVEADRVDRVEYYKSQQGSPPPLAAVAVSSVAVGIPAALFIRADVESRRKAEQEREAEYFRYAEARASMEGGSPLPPTEERLEDFSDLSWFARCMGVKANDLAHSTREDMAQEVWVSRERCLPQAASWFRKAGEPARARTLGFIESARERYESLACQGSGEVYLKAPDIRDVDPADDDWMEEYRSVVANPETYSYRVRASCQPDPDAITAATRSFSLTDTD